MNGALGRYIRGRRIELGLDQAEVAHAVGVSGSTLCRWEQGRYHVPQELLEPLSVALEVPVGELTARLTRSIARLPVGLKSHRIVPPRFPPYDIKGSLDEMLAISQEAREAYERARRVEPRDAVHEDLIERFPRDSPFELYAAYRYVGSGASLVEVSLLALGFRRLVIQRDTWRYVGDLLRPALLLQLENGFLLAVPQVSMAVVPQSMERRADFLLLYVEGRSRAWIDQEIDIALDLRNANDDARRSVGLGLVRMSITRGRLERSDFVVRVIDEARRILRSKKSRHRKAA